MDALRLEKIERQRRELEDNISKLRASLRHWQTWQIEYDGLREEIAGLPDGSNTQDALATARDFRPEFVTEKELHLITTGREGSMRDIKQILDVLEKRVEYVSRNVQTLERQLSEAQKRRNALLLAEDPDHRRDAGLPLTDITEELDDQGNLRSSKVETPATTAPQLAQVLKRAGVRDVLEQNGVVTSDRDAGNSGTKNQPEVCTDDKKATPTSSEVELAPSRENSSRRPIETVSEDASLHEEISDGAEKAGQAGVLCDGFASMNVNDEGSHIPEVPSASSIPDSSETGVGRKDGNIDPHHPDDTPEDAALRREMLEYGFGEVGAIVAELELEEDGSMASGDEDEAAFFSDSDIDAEKNSEDESGMEKHPTMSGKYLEKMKSLEQKYSMQNAGPDASNLPDEVRKTLEKPADATTKPKSALAKEAKRNDAIGPAKGQQKKDSPEPKKKVAFADDLDIAPESHSSKKPLPRTLDLDAEPMKDSIVERQVPSHYTEISQATHHHHHHHRFDPKPSSSPTTRPLSKFKENREAIPQAPLLPQTSPLPYHQTQTQPPHSTSQPSTTTPILQSPTIIERPPTNRSHPPNPPTPTQNSDDEDDLDDDHIDTTQHYHQIATEYYRLRNRAIQRQGGFVQDDHHTYANEHGHIYSARPQQQQQGVNGDGGATKKVSRFLAARLI